MAATGSSVATCRSAAGAIALACDYQASEYVRPLHFSANGRLPRRHLSGRRLNLRPCGGCPVVLHGTNNSSAWARRPAASLPAGTDRGQRRAEIPRRAPGSALRMAHGRHRPIPPPRRLGRPSGAVREGAPAAAPSRRSTLPRVRGAPGGGGAAHDGRIRSSTAPIRRRSRAQWRAPPTRIPGVSANLLRARGRRSTRSKRR